MEVTLPILTGASPPWWAALSAPHQAEINGLFHTRPVGAAAWLVWCNSIFLRGRQIPSHGPLSVT